MQPFGEMQFMASNIFSAYASMAATMMVFRSMANDMLPEPVKSFFHSTFSCFFEQFMRRFFNRSKSMTIVVDEQSGFTRNQIYDAAEVYLRTKINPDTERLKVNKGRKQKSISLSMEKDQEVLDWYKGLELKWKFFMVEHEGDKGRFQEEKRFFELTFEKSNREVVINEYLPFVLAKAKEMKENERAIKLFTRDCPYHNDDDDEGGNGGGDWGCINLDHPVTFEKLAMDPSLKRSITEDLDRFVGRKDYYRKVGKAWKRGYLLYGPPGTGKSSLVAAMANYLRFDVYDLELSSLYDNSDLRRILLCTNNKSIIVIEDIDCSTQTHDRDRGDNDTTYDDKISSKRLTLSGLLNFMDGLWSSCGDERIIIFTTNHKEKLDPALLRPGRMDMHIHMGYCTPDGFDVLAFNYLEMKDHPVFFPKIKGLISEVDITPAEIAEHLMRSENADVALEGVIDLLEQKKQEKQEKQEKKEMQGDDNNDGKGNVPIVEAKKTKNSKLGKIFTGFMKFKIQSKVI